MDPDDVTRNMLGWEAPGAGRNGEEIAETADKTATTEAPMVEIGTANMITAGEMIATGVEGVMVGTVATMAPSATRQTGRLRLRI